MAESLGSGSFADFSMQMERAKTEPTVHVAIPTKETSAGQVVSGDQRASSSVAVDNPVT